MTTLTDLRKLAEAATPGPWTHEMVDSAEMFSARNFVLPNIAGVHGQANAAYIAALSPDSILALIACVRAADAMRQDKDCPMCDRGKLRNPNKEHWDDCAFAVYDAARAALEKEQGR